MARKTTDFVTVTGRVAKEHEQALKTLALRSGIRESHFLGLCLLAGARVLAPAFGLPAPQVEDEELDRSTV